MLQRFIDAPINKKISKKRETNSIVFLVPRCVAERDTLLFLSVCLFHRAPHVSDTFAPALAPYYTPQSVYPSSSPTYPAYPQYPYPYSHNPYADFEAATYSGALYDYGAAQGSAYAHPYPPNNSHAMRGYGGEVDPTTLFVPAAHQSFPHTSRLAP